MEKKRINQTTSPFFFGVSWLHHNLTPLANPDRLDILSNELLALHLANNELQWLPNKLPKALQVLDLRSLAGKKYIKNQRGRFGPCGEGGACHKK